MKVCNMEKFMLVALLAILAPNVAHARPYLYPFDDFCVGSVTLFQQALPCPASCVEHCFFAVNLTASSWSFFEGNPQVDFTEWF